MTAASATRLIPHRNLQRANDGRYVIGGSPSTIMHLTAAGRNRVDAWFRGEALTDQPTELQLAARLVRTGMATAAVDSSEAEPSRALVVIIPVHDDADGLRTTINSLGSVAIVVVDNGSPSPVDAADLPDGAALIRTESPTGPADARNRGLAHASVQAAEAIAFVDAGVSVSSTTLHELVAHLLAPVAGPVVAAAPRVRSSAGPTALDRYEQTFSPLDLGPTGGHVAPGRPLAYVPSACLVVLSDSIKAHRRGATQALFDTDLRFGEDVDLIWRLHEDGAIRYIPTLVAVHPARPSLREFARQRMNYGSAAGPLAARHGEHLTPFRTSPWGAIVAVAAFAGHPAAAVIAACISGELLARQLPADLEHRRMHAHRISTTGHAQTIVAVGAAVMRTWWPVVVLFTPWAPRAALRLTGVGTLRRLVGSRHENRPSSVSEQIVLGVVDDLSYSVGVWRGSARARKLGALLPQIKGRWLLKER